MGTTSNGSVELTADETCSAFTVSRLLFALAQRRQAICAQGSLAFSQRRNDGYELQIAVLTPHDELAVRPNSEGTKRAFDNTIRHGLSVELAVYKYDA